MNFCHTCNKQKCSAPADMTGILKTKLHACMRQANFMNMLCFVLGNQTGRPLKETKESFAFLAVYSMSVCGDRNEK